MNTLMVRKSKHVIINEDRSADRLRNADESCHDDVYVKLPQDFDEDETKANNNDVPKRADNKADNEDDVIILHNHCNNSTILNAMDKFISMACSVYDSVACPSSNEHVWNVFVVTCYVFYEIFFHLVMGIATILVAVVLSLGETDTHENKTAGCKMENVSQKGKTNAQEDAKRIYKSLFMET